MAKILLVEDSPTQAALLKHTLGKWAHQVVHRKDALSAFEECLGNHPDLVISDVTMEGMDGYDLCSKIKETEAISKIPVLLVTGLANPEDIVSGLECGADGYLTKPYLEEDLKVGIERLIGSGLEWESESPFQVNIFGKDRNIRSSRRQMLNLLLCVYETTATQNRRYHKKELELKMEIRQLQAEREELEEQLAEIGRAAPEPSTANNGYVDNRNLKAG